MTSTFAADHKPAAIPEASLWSYRYRAMLLEDVISFWLRHAPDPEHGGIYSYLDRDGTLLSTDKAIWLQGRCVWTYAHLFNTVRPDPAWLALSDSTLAFLERHGFDDDGRMFFTVTGDGRPLRKRRYQFSETFAIIGLAENAVAHRDAGRLEKAISLFRRTVALHRSPDATTPPKINPTTRPLRGHSMPMILLATARSLRGAVRALQGSDAVIAECTQVITDSAAEVRDYFYKPAMGALLETVLADGSFLDTPEGRTVNPGHAIETSWFLLEEARERGDAAMRDLALGILRDSLERGWDREHGGILYFVDVHGKPADPMEHDMKLWWPHCEAMYATLLAFAETGDPELLAWYEKVRDWTLAHFPDPEHGEWFGYLLRDGTPSKLLKGNMWKGPFHIPRALLKLQQLCAASAG